MIFYLSGTGNTKWAAESLARLTGEQLVDIFKVDDNDMNYSLAPNERIGFCFPVHGWRPPLFLRKFISRLKLQDSDKHYCYAVCTAGDNIGETIDILKKDLSRQGITLDSAFSLIMPESYVGLPFMDVDTQDNERLKKEKAEQELAEYGKLIINREKDVWRLTIGKWPRVNSRLLGGFFTDYLITDKRFHVDKSRCISCGICSKVCPVENIVINDNKYPQWQHNGSCLTCFSCYHHCPVHAIEFGRMTRHKGQYYFNKNEKAKNESSGR